MEKQKVRIADILSSPSVTYWVKNQYMNAVDRDPIDAISDAHLLLRMLETRFEEIAKGKSNG